jgi:Phenylacetic acid-responsive transcriptional repressor
MSTGDDVTVATGDGSVVTDDGDPTEDITITTDDVTIAAEGTIATDDVTSRPGSAASLVLTIVGLYLRRVGGWMSTATLVRLAEEVGSPAPSTRTAIARLKKRNVVVAARRDGVPGYAVHPGAIRMLQRGDRRIFTPRSMAIDDPWCLISFSLPEQQRAVRHQLRRRLLWIGCGIVAPALWICPDYLADEVEEILHELGIRHHATLFRSELPRVAGRIEDAVARWWDLAAIAAAHHDFIAAVRTRLPDRPPSAAEAFLIYVTGIDVWRTIPYIDPGLPPSLLPPDWPGRRSVELFTTLSDRLAEPAWQHVRDIVSTFTRLR